MMEERLTRPDASGAFFGPRFASPAAGGTHASKRKREEHDQAAGRFAPRQAHFGAQDIALRIFAEEGVAHPVDDAAHGREVDRDLVGKAAVGEAAMRHVCTIGAGTRLVKIARPARLSAARTGASVTRHVNAKGVAGVRRTHGLDADGKPDTS